VHGLQKHAAEVYAKYQQNERVLHAILLDQNKPLFGQSAQKLGEWISASCPRGFRWHVSGDLFSPAYAEWIKAVALASPQVLHWIYTRTLSLARQFEQSPNLVLNISADKDNYLKARKVAVENNLRLCYLTQDGTLPEDLPDGAIIFPDYQVRGRALPNPVDHPWWQGLGARERKMVCPADFFGQSEQHRCGVCRKCMVELPRVALPPLEWFNTLGEKQIAMNWLDYGALAALPGAWRWIEPCTERDLMLNHIAGWYKAAGSHPTIYCSSAIPRGQYREGPVHNSVGLVIGLVPDWVNNAPLQAMVPQPPSED
jgi:hypothetical protein